MDVAAGRCRSPQSGEPVFATFLDDYSKLSVVVPLKQENEVAKVTEHVINRLGLQSRKKLRSVLTDRGKGSVNKALKDVFGGKGTVHEKTAPYTAEKNGSAERLNPQLKEKVQAMLEDLGLPKEMWADSVVTANYTWNRTPVSAHGRTPWEAFYDKKPNRRRKLVSVSERCVFVGYEPDSKAYRVLWNSDGRIVISRDVIFDEGEGNNGFVELICDLMEGSPEASGKRDITRSHPRPTTRTRPQPTAAASHARFPKPTKSGGQVSEMRNQEAVGGEASDPWAEAHGRGDAFPAEERDVGNLERLIEVKPGPVKWVYKIKRDAHRNVERYKSWLVAKGYPEKQGIDFDEELTTPR
ncbi:hypothetical protein KFL_010260010, partial [Klebsormidium nitens]